MRKLGMEKGEAIEHRMVTRSIEKAQRKVEGRNFDIRKQLLEFDNVANDQRTIIYRQRNELMASDDVSELIEDMRSEVVSNIVDAHIPPQSIPEQWDVGGLESALDTEFGSALPIQQWLDDDDELYEEQLKEKVAATLADQYAAKCAPIGERMRTFEKQIVLQILDNLWKEHLATMDQLRQGIFLRSYSGKNPKQEYKREAFALFQDLLTNIQEEVVKMLSLVQVRQEDEADAIERQREEQRARERMQYQHAAATAMSQEGVANDTPAGRQQETSNAPFVRDVPKVGRNEPCPCGSGKKYKVCHGRLA